MLSDSHLCSVCVRERDTLDLPVRVSPISSEFVGLLKVVRNRIGISVLMWRWYELEYNPYPITFTFTYSMTGWSFVLSTSTLSVYRWNNSKHVFSNCYSQLIRRFLFASFTDEANKFQRFVNVRTERSNRCIEKSMRRVLGLLWII